MEAVVFFVSAAVILGGGLGVIVLRNPVHAALSLVATLFGVAIQFISLEAYFLAAVQVIVYAGAIVVLFLFVIMLLGVDRAEDVTTEPIVGQRQFALLAGAGLLVLAALIGLAFAGDVTGIAPSTAGPSDGGLAIVDTVDNEPAQNVREIGKGLFASRYVFAFEITAILLTIAVVGAVVLARRPKGELEELPEVDAPWNIRRPTEPAGDGDAAADESEASAEGGDGTAEGGEETADGGDGTAEGDDTAETEGVEA